VRKWLATEEQPANVGDAVALLLVHIVTPRVDVFTLLPDVLGQAFSLDNGVALQTAVLHWLQLVHRGPSKKRARGEIADVDGRGCPRR
jgi:hypothetical protein